MSRPPIKALTAIKNYCEKTQCRRCVFGFEERLNNYVGCLLLEKTPCDWNVEEKEADNEVN